MKDLYKKNTTLIATVSDDRFDVIGADNVIPGQEISLLFKIELDDINYYTSIVSLNTQKEPSGAIENTIIKDKILDLSEVEKNLFKYGVPDGFVNTIIEHKNVSVLRVDKATTYKLPWDPIAGLIGNQFLMDGLYHAKKANTFSIGIVGSLNKISDGAISYVHRINFTRQDAVFGISIADYNFNGTTIGEFFITRELNKKLDEIYMTNECDTEWGKDFIDRAMAIHIAAEHDDFIEAQRLLQTIKYNI